MSECVCLSIRPSIQKSVLFCLPVCLSVSLSFLPSILLPYLPFPCPPRSAALWRASPGAFEVRSPSIIHVGMGALGRRQRALEGPQGPCGALRSLSL